MLTFLVPLASAQFMASRSVCFITPSTRQSMKTTSLKSSLESGQGSSPFLTEHEAERSIYCVDHFGQCSVEEMETLRKKLHVERITNFVDETSGMASILDTQDEFDHFLLEEDLTLQLQLLENEMENASMEGSVISSISSKEVPAIINDVPESELTLPEGTGNSALFYGLPETIAICMAIVLLTMAPHLIQV